MKVVIVGPRDHKEKPYVDLVTKILTQSTQRYPKVLFITKSCDQGVGKIIREACVGTNFKEPKFDMLEITIRHHLTRELPKSEFQANFDSVNASLLEVGEEFHIILGAENPFGTIYDLIKRLKAQGYPFAVYKNSELMNGPKEPAREIAVQTGV
jgi:hypothetical protein